MKRTLIGSTVLAAALFGGGIAIGEIAGIPGTSAASAVPTATTTQTATTTETTPDTSAPSSFPAHGSAAHENAEKAVTGSAAAQAQAAAVKSVGQRHRRRRDEQLSRRRLRGHRDQVGRKHGRRASRQLLYRPGRPLSLVSPFG